MSDRNRMILEEILSHMSSRTGSRLKAALDEERKSKVPAVEDSLEVEEEVIPEGDIKAEEAMELAPEEGVQSKTDLTDSDEITEEELRELISKYL